MALFAEASADGAAVVITPELALSGYSLDDLHQQDALLGAVRRGLEDLAEATADTARFFRADNRSVLSGQSNIFGGPRKTTFRRRTKGRL